MKKSLAKLALRKETLRVLADKHLATVRGGDGEAALVETESGRKQQCAAEVAEPVL
jgi:hypothetical protein